MMPQPLHHGCAIGLNRLCVDLIGNVDENCGENYMEIPILPITHNDHLFGHLHILMVILVLVHW
jgi:hypothetical protein